MDNPEKLATSGTQYTEWKHTKQKTKTQHRKLKNRDPTKNKEIGTPPKTKK
jgi:hypothetical protein